MDKKYKILLTDKAEHNLAKLPKNIATRILDKLEYFERSANPFVYAKKLKDRKFGEYKFRIGDYRAIFDINDHGELIILYILLIGHRKDVYK